MGRKKDFGRLTDLTSHIFFMPRAQYYRLSPRQEKNQKNNVPTSLHRLSTTSEAASDNAQAMLVVQQRRDTCIEPLSIGTRQALQAMRDHAYCI
jgi:hypothetical protein